MLIDKPTTELAHGIDEALARAAKGERDTDRMAQSLVELTRLREALRRRIGIVDVAVELIREARER